MMFLHYYPAVEMAQCVSKLPLKNLLLAIGVVLWPVTPDTRHLGLRLVISILLSICISFLLQTIGVVLLPVTPDTRHLGLRLVSYILLSIYLLAICVVLWPVTPDTN